MRVLITGANRGIGAALDTHLAAAGHEVLGCARSDPDYIPLDVTKPADFDALAARLDGAPLDLLICNAGVYLDKGDTLADGFRPEKWARTFAVNVTGVFLTVQSLLPNLRAAAGKMAIISSQMGSSERAPGGSYIYRASKAAAVNLGRNLSADLAHLQIPVGIYHPGWVRTDMGGGSAALSTDQSAKGLIARFAALSMQTTGCFETWDGKPYPF